MSCSQGCVYLSQGAQGRLFFFKTNLMAFTFWCLFYFLATIKALGFISTDYIISLILCHVMLAWVTPAPHSDCPVQA